MNILFTLILAASVVGSIEHNVVTPAWLERNLDNPAIVVVEIGSSPTLDRPHIPGARYVAIESLLSRDKWPPDELPPVEQLRLAFENAGVGDDGRIILYSANPLHATRAWFTLDYLGQADRVAILDGGFARWQLEKRPVATRRMPRLAKTFTPRPDPARVVSHADMRAAVDSGTAILIDARSAREFHGFRRGQAVVRRGHVPGAKCDPWQANLMKNGGFLPGDRLRTRFEELIGPPGGRLIVYCRTGMEATLPYFVLRSLGYDVALYDGSFAEWSRDKTAAVAKLSTRP